MTLIISNWDESILNDIDQYGIVRSGTNKPELRQKNINDLLKKYYTIIKPEMKLTNDDIINMHVHSKEYISFLKGCYKSWHDMEDDQYYDIENGGILPLNFSNKKNNTEFYETVISKLPIFKQMGYFGEDKMTPIYKNTYDNALSSANNGFVATEYLKSYDVVYCSNLMPGHHASYNTYAGYCFLNNASICANKLQILGYKVAILDIDYHAGNGTQQIYENSTNVLTVSIHADPTYDYPSFIGFENETGPNNLNHNIIFPKKAKLCEYKKCLEKALGIISDFSCDVIVLAFGGDTYVEDSDASVNYGCSLEIVDYFAIGQKIKELGKKIIVTSEGGYDMDEMPNITLSLLRGLSSS
jgi:acetoin utilization deacetylase AcuC-like enzyme